MMVKLDDETVHQVTLKEDEMLEVLNFVVSLRGFIPIHENVIEGIDIIDNPAIKKDGEVN